MAGIVQRDTLRLRDGRRLTYALLGAPLDGARAAAIYHHGWPSSAQEAMVASAAAAEQGIALVAFDRPGIGGSSYHAGLSFSAVAGDVAQLMDELGLAAAVQIGTSGGAPHAAACAALLGPRRVPSLVLIAPTTHTRGAGAGPLLAGMDPLQRVGYALMAALPHVLIRAGLAGLVGVSRLLVAPLAWAAARWLDERAAGAPPGGSRGGSRAGSGAGSARSSLDVSGQAAQRQGFAAAAAPSVQAAASVAAAGGGSGALPGRARRRSSADGGGSASGGGPQREPSLRAAAAGGLSLLNDVVSGPWLAAGWWQDMELTCEPWGEFNLDSITVPTLVVRGADDTCVTAPMAAHLAAAIPGARAPAALAAADALVAAFAAAGGAARADGGVVVELSSSSSASGSSGGSGGRAAGDARAGEAASAGSKALRAAVAVAGEAAASESPRLGRVARVEVAGRGHIMLALRCMGPIFEAAAAQLPLAPQAGAAPARGVR